MPGCVTSAALARACVARPQPHTQPLASASLPTRPLLISQIPRSPCAPPSPILPLSLTSATMARRPPSARRSARVRRPGAGPRASARVRPCSRRRDGEPRPQCWTDPTTN
eukprot:351505-Chlamydomonas_euryale.AAC.13